MRPPRSRRRFLGTIGTAAVTALAGCAAALGTTGRFSVTHDAAEPTPALDADAYGAYVTRMRERYGRHGVWGTASDGSTEALSFVGAWRGRETLVPDRGGDGTPTDGAADPIAPIDWALALYRLPDGADPSEAVRHRCWLWAGAVPQSVEGRVGKTSLTALSVGVSLTEGSMGPYAPGSTVGPDRSPATLSPARPGPPGPRGTLVVRTGRVQTDPDTTRVGPGGGFGVTWAGGSASPVSVAGVCDIDRPPGTRYTFAIPVAAAGGRGRF